MAKPLKILKRWLYLGHRWLGIVTCLLFAIWFVSGVVMMYVGFPALRSYAGDWVTTVC